MRLAEGQHGDAVDVEGVRPMPAADRVPAQRADDEVSPVPDTGTALRLPTVSTAFVVTVVAMCLALGWLLPPFIGDATPLQMYWLVLPATIAGFRFGIPGAAATSVVCWLVSGPLAPLLPGGKSPTLEALLGQGVFLAVVSIAVAVLVRRVKLADARLLAVMVQQAQQATHAANERGALTQELQRRINQDELTGLANRTAFVACLEQELRTRSDTTAVLFVDLDDFKTVNDTLGHAVGDELIIAVGQRLSTGIRGDDVVARFGGDEFAVLLADVNASTALRAAQRILGELKAPFNLCGRTVPVRASGGLAASEHLLPGSAEQHALELLKQADLAMYASKVQRTRGVTVYHEEMQSEMRDRLALESDMHRGLADAQFFLDYQPIIDVRNGHVRAVEALMRWHHPERGLIPPSVFVPVAEQTGIIVPLTLWAVRHACAQLRTWDDDPLTRGLSIAINISGRLVVEPGVGAAVARELHYAGIEPKRIILEITESLLMEDRGTAVQTLCQLRALGMRLSVDDFGTGYSSLSRLNTLPIDEVKIDRSFIEHLTTEAGRTIVIASIAMAHGLGLRVVAEGVETQDQFGVLLDGGCDDAQGFYFSRPVAPDAIGRLMAPRGCAQEELVAAEILEQVHDDQGRTLNRTGAEALPR